MHTIKRYFFFIGLLFLSACQGSDEARPKNQNKVVFHQAVNDSHSYANVDAIHTSHLHLELDVNFDNQSIYGIARHKMVNSGCDTAIFDIKGLEIQKVTIGAKGDEVNTDYMIGKYDSILGAPLAVKIAANTELVNIYYKTTAESDALDWLDASLTEGKKHPYLYTQGQAILTRTWIPIQDTPANKITYSADVKVPVDLLALMSAENPKKKSSDGLYHFKMDQAIAPYLIALAVGDLEYRMLGRRCGVYSEPAMLRKAAWEFSELPQLIGVAESIYGKYQWKQYDILVLPYSFPFGGMENPRLTFANPTIITGDRSLISVIAHELAHSWSGNLVTNATWEDFWLNEGFTVYFEHRIMEALYGEETAKMLSIIELQELNREIDVMNKGKFPEDSKLKLNLKYRSPDEGMTTIAYVKGAYFLKTLEHLAGREVFDEFITGYFDHFQFSSLTTETFEVYLKDHLLTPNKINFNVSDWLYNPNLPRNAYVVDSKKLVEAEEMAKDFIKGKDIFSKKYNHVRRRKELKRESLSTQEWMAFIRALPKDVSIDKLREIDQHVSFKSWKNSEVATEWYLLAIAREYTDVDPYLKKFLMKIGRLKFIEPIYVQLAKRPESKKWAIVVFAEAANNYHPISRNAVKEILL